MIRLLAVFGVIFGMILGPWCVTHAEWLPETMTVFLLTTGALSTLLGAIPVGVALSAGRPRAARTSRPANNAGIEDACAQRQTG